MKKIKGQVLTGEKLEALDFVDFLKSEKWTKYNTEIIYNIKRSENKDGFDSLIINNSDILVSDCLSVDAFRIFDDRIILVINKTDKHILAEYLKDYEKIRIIDEAKKPLKFSKKRVGIYYVNGYRKKLFIDNYIDCKIISQEKLDNKECVIIGRNSSKKAKELINIKTIRKGYSFISIMFIPVTIMLLILINIYYQNIVLNNILVIFGVFFSLYFFNVARKYHRKEKTLIKERKKRSVLQCEKKKELLLKNKLIIQKTH